MISGPDVRPQIRCTAAPMSRRYARTIALASAGTVAAVAAGLAGNAGALRSSGAVGARSQSASAKAFAAHLSYKETNSGRQRGSATIGILGRGSFSAALGRSAALEAAIISLATGVPVSSIAQGGTYVVQRDIAGDGSVKGLAIAKLKAHGLGTVCLSYTEKPGKFKPGMSFVPMSGQIKTLGGSGAAARWRVDVSFRQNSVSGSQTEQFSAGGTEHASTGRAMGMSAACRRVASLVR